MCPTAIVGVWQDNISHLSLPQAYKLLQVLEGIASSDQKPTRATSRQSLKSPCPKRPTNSWPELWEPKASLYIHLPKLQTGKPPSEKLQTGSSPLKLQPGVSLPPLQKRKQAATTARSKWTSRLPIKTVKEAPHKLVKISNLKQLDVFPVVSMQYSLSYVAIFVYGS